MPDDRTLCLASMGIYVFTAPARTSCSARTPARSTATRLRQEHHPAHHRQRTRYSPTASATSNRKAMPYWRDVGTLDAYYQANMDLVAVEPVLNLYDKEWPIRTNQPQLPPPKFVFCDEGRRQRPPRRGPRQHGLPGLHRQRRPRAPQHPVAERAHQQLCDGGQLDPVRRRRRRPALPYSPSHHRQGRPIPQHSTIGYDLDHDRQRGFLVTEGGVVVIAKAELPETFAKKIRNQQAG